MKAIWKGSIGFGLVNIPVKLYSAVEQSNLDLDMVDSRDHSKIRFQRINETTGKEVKWENIAKAYFMNDDYILLDDADFEEAAPEKSKIIEVNQFVDENEIDPIYYESSYYIQPEKSGIKAYSLLYSALTKSGKVGIAQFVMRTAEALTVLRPYKDVLLLSKIRFSEEVRDISDLGATKMVAVKPQELKMALSLIKQYSKKFDIEKYKDEYAKALLKVIKAKASGKRQPVRKLKVAHRHSDDLMDQLKQSLSKKKAS
ncbi:MAG: Ku protein [Bacteroidetes bacterium]|nr:Ku protein [Bacteroidota bacterium]